MKKRYVFIFMSSIILSCSPKTAPVASNQPSTLNAVVKPIDTVLVAYKPIDMAIAEQQFKLVCSKCHNLPSTLKHNATEWPNTVARMQRKSGFNDTQKEQILVFLIANARQ